MRLILVGSVIVDLVLPVAALPERGGDVLAIGGGFRVGGGMYVLRAAAAAGAATAYAGHVGTGPFGDQVRSALARLGTDVLLDPDPSADTGVCVVLVEPDGERTFITRPGAEAHLDAPDLAPLTVLPADTVYVSGYDLVYDGFGTALARWLSRLDPSATLAVDLGPLVAEIPGAVLDQTLARTDICTLNRREWALLTRADNVAAAAAALSARLAPQALVVLRDGARGATISGGEFGESVVHIPAPQVEAGDTTGAGDVHTGTLLGALMMGQTPEAACRAANEAAAAHVARADCADR